MRFSELQEPLPDETSEEAGLQWIAVSYTQPERLGMAVAQFGVLFAAITILKTYRRRNLKKEALECSCKGFVSLKRLEAKGSST